MNKNIVILGCPRSGTSLLANLIRLAGYDIDANGTQKLMKPNAKYNPDGYFERIDIVKLNDKLIKEINTNYSFLNPPNILEIQKFNSNNLDLIDLSLELSNNIGWIIKDSRLSFTFHTYKNLHNIHIIKIVRDPAEVKQSMINHYGNLFEMDVVHGPHKIKQIDFDKYYKNINECIDWQKEKYNNIMISYNDIINNKLDILEDFIESKIDRKIINVRYRNYKV
jgi:hypothetical protein